MIKFLTEKTLTSTIVLNFIARAEIRTTEEITANDQSGPGTGPATHKSNTLPKELFDP